MSAAKNSFMKKIGSISSEKKVDRRTHKWEHTPARDPQRDVDEHMRNFGDNF